MILQAGEIIHESEKLMSHKNVGKIVEAMASFPNR